MKLIGNGVLLVTSILCLISTAAGQPKEVEQWETDIRKSISSFVDAFNRGDAAAVAFHWTEDAEYLAPDDETYVGRTAIQICTLWSSRMRRD